jgi:hypothetical protein
MEELHGRMIDPATWVTCSSTRLSTACMHTLWMPWLSVLALRCCLVGQTPIYDQLRGERINADVPPSPIDSPRPADPGRHRLDAQAPSAAAVVVRPSGAGTDGLAGQHRQVRTHRGAQLAGEELGSGRAWGPQAAMAGEAHAQAAPRHAGPPPAPAAGSPPAAPAAAAGGGAPGHQAVGAARPVQRPDPRPAAVQETAFSWFVP